MARKRNTNLEHFLGSHPKLVNDHWPDQMMISYPEVAPNRRLVHAQLPMKLPIRTPHRLESDISLFGNSAPGFVFNTLYLIIGRRDGSPRKQRLSLSLGTVQ